MAGSASANSPAPSPEAPPAAAGWALGGPIDTAFEHMSGLRDDQALIIKAIETQYQDLAIALGVAPPCADRSAAFRALRQSYLWFVEAIRTDGGF